MCVGDSGNNESSLDIFHDQFSNTQLDERGLCFSNSNTDAAHTTYLASSFLPASRLSKFRMVLNTMK